MKLQRGFATRDQDLTSFAATLGRLCDSLPALAAALVDAEGETVDYAGSMTPFDIKVTAAEWQIVADLIKHSVIEAWRSADILMVRARGRSYALFLLPVGYSLVICLPYGAFTTSHRAIAEAVREICEEAGMPLPARYQDELWLRVDVQESGPPLRRPEAVWMKGAWKEVEVLGVFLGAELHPREIGFRVRFESGLEATLVRERLGRWYSDHLI
ncbi:MAG: hypothetical protein RJA70_2001 [Pseudomonadota bacterium]|jgi:hypothetical protein